MRQDTKDTMPPIFGITPLPLTADDIAALEDSYISPDVAASASVFRVDSNNGAALVGQSPRNGRCFSGVVFPYLSPDGKVLECRLRRDFPDLEINEKGEEKERARYLGPPDRRPRLYRSAPHTRELLRSGAQIERYVFVEGEKKALALDRFFAERGGRSVVVFALAGVDSFSCRAEKRDHTTKPKKVWVTGLLPELTAIDWTDADVWILFDANVHGNIYVKSARRRLTNQLTARGARVLHVEIPEGTPGVNGIDDLLSVNGPDFVADLFEQQVKKPALTAVRFYASPHQDMKPLTVKVWEVLEDSERLFGRSILWSGGLLSRIQPQVDRVKIEELTLDLLCYRLIDLARWYNRTKSGDEYLTTPPPKLIANMIAAPMTETPIPSLNRVVAAPVFTATGALLLTPGYDEGSGIYYLETFDVLPPPSRVTDADVEAAVKYLDENLFADFPFANAADRCHAYALLILPFVREMIAGPTPLHLIEAAIRGAGKGLLTKVCLLPALGQGGIGETPQPEDDAEMRKAITSALIENKGALIIDNATRKLDSGALAAALTSSIWSDRVLGSNKTASADVRLIFVVTANNLEISSEMVRRSIPIRLAPDTDAPEDRTGFKHEILLEWIAESRAEIVRAIHVIILNWIANGMPAANITLGSYENWARIIGGILRHAGISGFLQNRKELRERSDIERGARAGFCDEWWERRRIDERAIEAAGKTSVSKLRRATSAELYAIARDIEGLPIETYTEQGAIKSFGKYLSASEGVCPEHVEKDSDTGQTIYTRRFRIVRAGTRKRAVLWEIELLEGPEDSPVDIVSRC